MAHKLEDNKIKILIKTLDQAGFGEWEKRMPKIHDTTVIIFPSYMLAVHMLGCFIHYDLIPRVGSKEEATKFPFTKTGPSRDGCDMLSEALGLKEPPNDEETWFLIGNSRFQEFYDYLVKKYPEMNPNIEIQDLR